jgi:retinol dehydrogenase-12
MLKKIRQLIICAPLATPCDLTGRKFIVTGASENSLGFATAKILLEWGAEVTVTSRSNSERIIAVLQTVLSQEAHSRIYAHNLDLSNAESTKRFAGWYKAELQQLDVLINNAGIHLDLLSQWKAPKRSDDGFEIQWRTNYLGTVLLSHLLLPLLKESAAKTNDARIVNVVSMLHKKGSNSEFFNPSRPYNSWEAYGQSKLGVVHFTTEFQKRFSNDGIQAFCLHPGSVYTNIAGKGLAGHPFIEAIRNSLAPVEGFFMKTPEEGAQTQVLCATAPDSQGGKYYRDCKVAKAAIDTNDRDIAKKLWEQTIEWMETL